jgi:hypothetical protein
MKAEENASTIGSGDADPFESPKLLLAGAREDIDKLKRECDIFTEQCRGVPFAEIDRQTGDKLVKVRITHKPPGRLRVTASNALNNLRHSLDQVVNAAAFELGSKKRDNYFPFARDAGSIDEVIRSNCRNVPSDLIPLLKAFQPYGGGDDLLYSMSRLSGPNKHQIVLKLNVNLTHLLLGAKTGFRLLQGPADIGVLRWDSSKQELDMVRIKPGGRFDCERQIKLPLFVTLGDSEPASREPAAAFLDALAGKVESIIMAIEAETTRLLSGAVVRDRSA